MQTKQTRKIAAHIYSFTRGLTFAPGIFEALPTRTARRCHDRWLVASGVTSVPRAVTVSSLIFPLPRGVKGPAWGVVAAPYDEEAAPGGVVVEGEGEVARGPAPPPALSDGATSQSCPRLHGYPPRAQREAPKGHR